MIERDKDEAQWEEQKQKQARQTFSWILCTLCCSLNALDSRSCCQYNLSHFIPQSENVNFSPLIDYFVYLTDCHILFIFSLVHKHNLQKVIHTDILYDFRVITEIYSNLIEKRITQVNVPLFLVIGVFRFHFFFLFHLTMSLSSFFQCRGQQWSTFSHLRIINL